VCFSALVGVNNIPHRVTGFPKDDNIRVFYIIFIIVIIFAALLPELNLAGEGGGLLSLNYSIHSVSV